MARKRRSTPPDPPREAVEKQRAEKAFGSVRQPVATDSDADKLELHTVVDLPALETPEPEATTPTEPTPVPTIRPPGVIRRRPQIPDSQDESVVEPPALFPDDSETSHDQLKHS